MTAIGDTLGGFRLEAELARGPLGRTFRASDPAGLAVALKTLDLTAHADMPRRFEREAAVLARLHHPAIAACRGHGRRDLVGWIATDFVAAGDLGRHLAAGTPLTPAAVLGWGARLADALDHAHRQGIVHRDVKPGNVLLDPQADRVQLVDFGIAALHDALRTRTGALAGTPAYMPPEALAGAAPGAAADVYALAATLYEAVAGRPPHRADSLGALLRAVAQDPVAPPSHWRAGVPAAFDAALLPALARDPARRPRSAAAFARTLREAAAALTPPS